MKKALFPILALVLALGLALPLATPGLADVTETVVSDASTEYWDWGADSTWGTGDDGWVPAVPCWVHPSWADGPGTDVEGATWIWRAYQIVPLTEYNTLPPEGYRTFRKTFDIPSGANIASAEIAINADNAYELRINGSLVDNEGSMGDPLTAPDGQEWNTIHTTDCTNDLLAGATNTIEIRALNFYNYGSSTSNPAGVIYKLTYTYEEPVGPAEIEVDKDYRYTDVCFEKDNDGDGQFNEDPVDLVDNDLDGLVDEDPVDCPLGTDLGDLLPQDGEDNYTLEAVIHPKNDKVKSYNPGQYYAVSTVNVLEDVDMLTIVENWTLCAGISALNPPKGGGSVVIVQVGPGDAVAYQILDATSDAVTISGTTATAVLHDVLADTTILMYVKFGPGLKGVVWAGPYGPCENFNSAMVDAEEPMVASATLKLDAKD